MAISQVIKGTVVIHKDPPDNKNHIRKFYTVYRHGLATESTSKVVIERYVAGETDTNFEWLDYEAPIRLVLVADGAEAVIATWVLKNGSLGTGVQLQLDTVDFRLSGSP